jgi:hypothetical protein
MTILELQRKYNDFVANIDNEIKAAVNSVRNELTDLNREQLLISKGNDDAPLIHKSTNDEKLTKAYAKKTGKTYPNIYESGAYQEDMQIHVAYSLGVYSIDSSHRLNKYLPSNYKNLLGIAPSRRDKAYAITNKAIAARLK